jgi:hypothetical protein
MSLPQFIDLPGSSSYQHPFPLLNFNTQIFILPAIWEALVAATDQWLNHSGSLYRYVPLPFVACNPTWISRVEWTGWPGNGEGWMHETDFNFGLFVAGFKDLLIPDHFAIAQAFLVVDNPMTVIGGREIFGYRKMYGVMEYMANTWQPEAAATWVYKQFGPNEELQLAEVARVVPPELGRATPASLKRDTQELEKLFLEDAVMAAGIKFEHFLAAMQTPSFRIINLLQIRDAEDPRSAGYQALIEAPLEINQMNTAWVLPPGYRIKINNYPSYPILDNLGIIVDEEGMAKSVASFQLNMNCTLGTGNVLHAAGRHSLL